MALWHALFAVSSSVVAISAAAVPQDCPVELLTVTGHDDDFTLQESALEYLAGQRAPLYVVPVLGVARGGKSFVLNRLMGLEAPYENGFSIGHGQDTHTRGIFICAQHYEDLGTVVWMDTEGLFSAEYAASNYGPKIFSLALLFSSTVLLNSVKVLSELFFAFFVEQQEVSRALQQGLAKAGLPEGALLPRNLSIVWTLQQPVQDGGQEITVQNQLDAFLDVPGDSARGLVRRDFHHHLAVLPAASHDVRQWTHLHEVHEGELNPAFQKSMQSLSSLVFSLLSQAHPKQPKAVAAQLRMYAQLVQTQSFSMKLAKEAFEQSELAIACDQYAQRISHETGELPSVKVASVIKTVRPVAEQQVREIADRLHFQRPWMARLRTCLDHAEDELHRDNEAGIFNEWYLAAQQVQTETDDCLFLHQLLALHADKEEQYEHIMAASMREKMLSHAISLQRSRLLSCLRLKHMLWPLSSWLAWPLLSLYIGKGAIVSGMFSLAVHSVVIIGAYAWFHVLVELPPWLDLDFPVMQDRPQVLDVVMESAPWVPWLRIAQLVHGTGWLYCLLQFIRLLMRLSKPAGDQVAGMINLELKLNNLVKGQERLCQQQLLKDCQDAQLHAMRNQERETWMCLLRALASFVDTGSASGQLCACHIDPSVLARIRALQNVPQVASRPAHGVCTEWLQRDIFGCLFRNQASEAVEHMIKIAERIVFRHRVDRRGDVGDRDPLMEEFQQRLAERVERRRGSSD